MDSWAYWGPSTPLPPFFTFLFLLFSFFSTAVTLGKSTLRRSIVFIHLRPPAPSREKNAIRTLHRLESDFSRLCWTKKFAAVPQKIASCSEKRSKYLNFHPSFRWRMLRFCLWVLCFFLTARAVIWCFLLLPPGGSTHFQMGADAYLLCQQEELMRKWTLIQLMCGLWLVLTGRLEKKLRETVDQSEDSRCFQY